MSINAMQHLRRALELGEQPRTRSFKSFTRVQGFGLDDKVVALSAGYMLIAALTESGRVFICDTGFDGYAGLLPVSEKHGGWHPVNEV
jgi:hypothetical protein